MGGLRINTNKYVNYGRSLAEFGTGYESDA
jgi:hypothetical protein